MDPPRKITYRTGLFHPTNLTSQSEIDSALLEFSAVINRANYTEVLGDIIEKRYILVLVLSGIHEDIPLNKWILDDFPSTPNNFEKSFSYALLRRLCDFYLLYSCSADAETESLLRCHHHDVHQGSEILKILRNVSFVEEQNNEMSPPPSPTKKRAKVSQKEQKRARKLAREASSIDHKPFLDMSLTVPKNRDEANSLCEAVWLKMGSILDVLLEGIRRPEVIDFIHALFIPQKNPDELDVPAQSVIVEAPIPSPASPHVADEIPSSYPMVQSMKATFYFEPPVNFGKWRFLLASQAQCDLRQWKRRDNKMYPIILKKLNELSWGFFSSDNQKRLHGQSTDVPVFEAKMTGDLRLVYSVDCITDDDNQSEIQALRVFGIFTHNQMNYRLWENVSSFLSSRSREYRKRCLARRLHPDGGNIYLPQSFPEPIQVNQLEEAVEFNPSLPADDVNELHHIISLEKYVMLSKELLESIESNKDVNFPFEVSKNERVIIEHPHSCYVLGRSGTGKTITMLFKMLLIERDYQLSGKLERRPKQMFVTKSRALTKKVEENFVTYLSSLTFASHMDGHAPRKNMNTSDIFDEDDNARWGNDLPERFSELEERHFPLFITFDSLCTMLEADIQATVLTESINSSVVKSFGKVRSTTRKGRLITFDRFLAEYWPRLEQSRFQALLVFNEIIGVIIGSERALLSPNGYLDRRTYVNLSPRMYSIFAEHRETIYSMFTSYLKRKGELDDYDFADRTHAILRSMVKKSFAPQKVSHLYVDETQDNLLIDIFLLRLLCGNPDGLFWAGDTAQTISAGSSFRFNDLKAFLYRLQKARVDQEASMLIKLREPRMFFLSVNYRSHAGIVNCAHSIIEIIQKYWTNSIDSLPRERGDARGATPIFYTNMYSEFIRKGHFLSRDHSLHGKIESGANQCIIVRDDKAKDKLEREVGPEMLAKIGIVITLYDSKGQEFDDVLLYNFFHDSHVEKPWRLILNDVAYDGIDQTRIAAPKFDKTGHAAICSELKALYVATTRARNNLRIADESRIGEPMRALWESRGQILSCRPGEELTDFAKPSNEEEWANRGKLFFDNCQWVYAKQCYEKAGKRHAASVADAYLQREKARRIPSEGRGKARNLAFMAAAKAFESCAPNANDILARNKYLKLAASCWEEGDYTRLAVEAYRQGNWVADASRLYRKEGMFDEIHDIITQSDEVLGATIPETIRDATRLYFVSKKRYQKAHDLFDSVEEELDYLEDRSLHDAQLHLLIHHGQTREAADLYLSEGQTLKALDLYLQDTTKELDSMSKAKEIILNTLWQLSPFGVTPVEHDKMNKLLEKAKRIKPGLMDDNDLEEMMMFRAILDGVRVKLSELANSFLKRGNREAALLCYDLYFENLPPLTDEDIRRIAVDLRQFSEYVRILRDFAFLDDPTGNPRACKLFGFRTGKENGMIVLSNPNSLLNPPYFSEKDLDSNGNAKLTRDDLVTALQECLKRRLKDRVTRENDICHRSQALKLPCLHHIIRNCRDPACDRLHISPGFDWFQHWIQANILQIVIYHSISGIQYPKEFRNQQRFWLVKLYEALNPASHHFGPSNVRNTAIVASPWAVNVLVEWVQTVSFELDFQSDPQFLTFAMQSTDFAFTYDRKEAEVYMNRCGFVTSSCPPKFCREPHVNSLQEMLMSWNPRNSSSLWTGVLFISHVIKRRIPVNIHVFCSFIERICSLLIVCDYVQRRGNLHKIMLPRTWLKATLNGINVDDALKLQTSCFWYLLQPLERLIHTLYFPPARGNFQFTIGPEFETLETRWFIIRGLFIARICRVLGILGSNSLVTPFRDQILNIFTSLRQEVSHQELDLKFSNLHIGYLKAETFKGVYLATRRSMRGAVFDEMVRLLNSECLDARHPDHELPDLRDIVYSTYEELVSLLDAPNHPTLSRIEHDDTPFGDDVDEHDDGQELEVNDEIVEVAPESHELVPDIKIPEGVYAGHSELDMQAASVIQRVWRKFLDRKREILKAGMAASTRRWLELYRKALLPGMRSKYPRSAPQYYPYFLGPLPHLQAALDAIQPILDKTKELLKEGLGNHHQHLEEMGSNLTRINKAIKSLKRQQHQLRPESVLHDDCSPENLKKPVKDVFDIIDSIRSLVEMPDDLQVAFEIVYRTILQEPKPLPTSFAKEKRPQLVVEDLEDLIQDGHEGI